MPTAPDGDFRKDRAYPVVREFKTRNDARALLNDFDAHAVGIGPKIVDGEPTTKLALTFYVSHKSAQESLSPAKVVPKTFEFRSDLDGALRRVTTDVVESPPASFELDPKTRIRPVPGGVSVAPPTGTLGGWVWDQTDDTIVALSNDHVFGHVAGSPMPQPGTVVDGGSNPADTIGTTKRGIPRSAIGTNTVDCAVMAPTNEDIYSLTVHDIGPAVYATATPVLNMLVEKFGRTTEHTYGRLISVDYATMVSGLFFDDCLRIEPVSPSADWSEGGDSGSILFSQTPTSEGGTIKPAVGLHFAGGGVYGVACKIQNVFHALDLTTLCAGAFASFLDSLNESAESLPVVRVPELSRRPGVQPLTTADLTFVQAISLSPMLSRAGGFTDAVRRRVASLNPTRGLARDVQVRLQGSAKGRVLTDAVDTHRGELLTMLAKDGDVRRAALAALRPVAGKAVTTDDVMGRVLEADDVARLSKLADVVERRASKDLQAVLKDLRGMLETSEGRSLGQVFGVRAG